MMKYLSVLVLFSALFGGGERYLNWDAEQKLRWEDFQGDPDHSTEMKAHTTSRINYSWNCTEGEFTYTVEAVFDREKSWKKDIETEALLAHEQLHFDITELHARRLRQVFAELEDACDLPAEEIKEIGNQLRAQWKGEQKLYDLESDHGRDEMGQLIWEAKVAAGLEELGEYESKPQE